MDIRELIGKELTKELLEKISISYPNYRTARRLSLITADYQPDRLTVIVDEENKIISVDLG